ncbi:Ribonuclease III [hydrothermal vent metagenome]|uniref:ribonuclease III n=1 Tax=hydrothermal vent metagenome TaxID=652676 RepID=A0A3B0ZDW9_9ZZZZ
MRLSTEALAKSVGYQFKDPRLLDCAVTHRSAGSANNERLEFLGDAVLGQVVAEWLYSHFPDANEGQLSRLRASLVKREALAEIARGLALGDFLQLGSGELKSGGFRRDSILADALEAIFGAVLVDGGFSASHACIHGLYAKRFNNVSAIDELKDPKTRLQEYLQSRKLSLPEYEMVKVVGKAHKQLFDVECRVAALSLACMGQGGNRRKAEQAAATKMLEQLNADD